MIATTGAIILAAGSSSRLGKSKQLLRLDGITLLENAIRLLQPLLGNIVVVLGADESTHLTSIKSIAESKQITIVTNDQWSNGMGSSIKMGLRYLTDHTKINSVLLTVCDQPFLTTKHIERMLDTYREDNKSIVASYYENSPGVPVLFSSKHFRSLLSIADHEGAKKIIQQNAEQIALVDFPEGKYDIDTIDDVEEFRRMTGRELL